MCQIIYLRHSPVQFCLVQSGPLTRHGCPYDVCLSPSKPYLFLLLINNKAPGRFISLVPAVRLPLSGTRIIPFLPLLILFLSQQFDCHCLGHAIFYLSCLLTMPVMLSFDMYHKCAMLFQWQPLSVPTVRLPLLGQRPLLDNKIKNINLTYVFSL